MSLISDIFSDVGKFLLNTVSDTISDINIGVNAKTPSDEFQSGDVDLIDIVLMSEDGQRTYSLINQAATLDIYESVMSPIMWAEIQIADSQGLLESFPIIGEEFISIVFNTPGNSNDPVNYLFRVKSVNDKQTNESNKRLTYTLQCCSAEAMENAKVSVTETKKDSIDNIIKDIFDEYLGSSKRLTVAKTDGIEEVNITSLSPFQAIDYLRQRAVSSRWQSSSYAFYENRKGFHFAILEQMIDEGRRLAETGNHDKIFFYDTARNQDASAVSYRNVLAYNQIQFGDSITQVQEGGLNNEVQSYDLITGEVRVVTYTDNIGAEEFSGTSETSAGGHTTSFTRRHGRQTTTTRMITTRSDLPETNISERLSKSQAYAQKLAQNITQIHVYGDASINIGDVVECRFPSSIDSDDANAVSRLDSGFYVVTKVRHIILNGDRPQYTQALELIKTDLQEVSA